MRCFLVIWWAVLVAALAACSGSSEPSGEGGRRIVSLSPVVTQVLIELGLGDEIVAVGDLDPLAPAGVPSVGGMVDVDLERLLSLRPTHVLATSGAAGLPAELRRLAGEGASGEGGRFEVADLGYPDEVTDVADVIRGVGVAVGEGEAAERLAIGVLERLGALARRTAVGAVEGRGGGRPRVVLVFATGPVVASGPGTVLDEVLTIAGGVNAAGGAAVSAVTYDREGLIALAPDAVFLLEPGGAALREGDPRRDAVPAVDPGRVYLFNGATVLIPGPSLADLAEAMAGVLNDLGSGSDATTQALGVSSGSRSINSRDATRPWRGPGPCSVSAIARRVAVRGDDAVGAGR